MICFLTKWFLSNSLESNKNIPSIFKRHIQKCESCQKFQNSCQVIHKNAVKDIDAVLQQTPPMLSKRVKSRILLYDKPKKRLWQKRFLVPLISMAVLLAFATILFLYHPVKEPSFKKDRTALPVLSTFYESGEGLQSLASQIGLRYETEYNSLKKAVHSASQYFIKKLDLKINPSEKEESLT